MATRQNITPPSVSRRRATHRAAMLPAADRELFAAYQTFAAAYQKVKEADAATGRDAGSGADPSPDQKKAHRKWERALDRSSESALRFAVMPAKTIGGMLHKIQVAGWLMDAPGRGFKPLIDGPDRTLDPVFADDDQHLLARLRDDLGRLRQATAS